MLASKGAAAVVDCTHHTVASLPHNQLTGGGCHATNESVEQQVQPYEGADVPYGGADVLLCTLCCYRLALADHLFVCNTVRCAHMQH
jgi:hypothetical protein